MNSYASLCDDFGVSVYVHSKLEMPTGREPVLHFFEAVQKAFPKMTDFEKRDNGEYSNAREGALKPARQIECAPGEENQKPDARQI